MNWGWGTNGDVLSDWGEVEVAVEEEGKVVMTREGLVVWFGGLGLSWLRYVD